MPPNPAQKVPPVAHRVAPGPHSRDVNSCPREREGGYKPIPPDLPGGYRPPGRLLLQLQRLSSVAGFRLTPKGRWLYVCMYVCIYVYLLNCTQPRNPALSSESFYATRMYVCTYVCMYVCIPRNPALSSESFYATRIDPPKGGSMILVMKTSLIKRDCMYVCMYVYLLNCT